MSIELFSEYMNLGELLSYEDYNGKVYYTDEDAARFESILPLIMAMPQNLFEVMLRDYYFRLEIKRAQNSIIPEVIELPW